MTFKKIISLKLSSAPIRMQYHKGPQSPSEASCFRRPCCATRTEVFQSASQASHSRAANQARPSLVGVFVAESVLAAAFSQRLSVGIFLFQRNFRRFVTSTGLSVSSDCPLTSPIALENPLSVPHTVLETLPVVLEISGLILHSAQGFVLRIFLSGLGVLLRGH